MAPPEKDEKKDTSATLAENSQASYQNSLGEQAALILLYPEIKAALKALDPKLDEKAYTYFSTDRTQQIGQFGVTNQLTKMEEMELFFDSVTPAILSYLLPSIKLYKCLYNVGASPTNASQARFNYKTYDWRIPFDDVPVSYKNSDGIYESSEIVEDTIKDLLSGKGALKGAGIKSFNYQYVGTNPAEVNTNIKVSLELYFQNIEDLLKPINITKDDPRITPKPGADFKNDTFLYSNLVNQSARTFKDDITKQTIINEHYYRIKAIVGYAPIKDEIFDKFIDEESILKYNIPQSKIKNYKKNLKRAIESTKLILFLTPYSHNISFNDDATLSLKIEYHASVDKILNSEQADVLKISSYYVQFENAKIKLENFLDKRQAEVDNIRNADDSLNFNADDKEALIKELKNSGEFSDVMLDALKNENVGLKTALYASIYQILTGLDPKNSVSAKNLFSAQINANIVGVRADGNSFLPAAFDPQGRALQFAIEVRLKELEKEKRVGQIRKLNLLEINEKEEKDKLFFLTQVANFKASLRSPPAPQNPNETPTAPPPASPLLDQELLPYVENKRILLIGDDTMFKAGDTNVNSLFKQLEEVFKANNAQSVVPMLIPYGVSLLTAFTPDGALYKQGYTGALDIGVNFIDKVFKTTRDKMLLDNFIGKYDIVVSFFGYEDVNTMFFVNRPAPRSSDVDAKIYYITWANFYTEFVNSFLKGYIRSGLYTDGRLKINNQNNLYSSFNYYDADSFILFPGQVKANTNIGKRRTFVSADAVSPGASQESVNDGIIDLKSSYGIDENIFNVQSFNRRLDLLFGEINGVQGVKQKAFYDAKKLSGELQKFMELKADDTQEPNDLIPANNFQDSAKILRGDYYKNANNTLLLNGEGIENLKKKLLDAMKAKHKKRPKKNVPPTDPVVVATGTDQKQKEIQEKENNKFAKLTVEANGYVNVKFVLLGDLLDSAMECLQLIFPKESIPRIVLGNVEVEIPLMFSGMSSASTTSKTSQIIMNLADVPISLDYLQSFLLNKLVKPQRDTYTVMSFLKDVISDLIIPAVSPSVFGESVAINSNIRYSMLSLTVEAEDKLGRDPIFKMLPDEIGKNTYPALTDTQVDKLVELKDRIIGDPPEKTVDYLFIYCSTQVPQKLKGDDADDTFNKVFHFRIGTDKGLVKKITFNATDNRFYRESVAAQEGNLKQGLIKQVYDANITMFGNNIFRPGDFIYIEPTFAYVHGDTTRETDIEDKIGLGGYYQVINVSTNINDSGFETSMKCTFYSHRSYDKDGNPSGIKNRKIKSTTSPFRPTEQIQAYKKQKDEKKAEEEKEKADREALNDARASADTF
jgi:hypothetical protein